MPNPRPGSTYIIQSGDTLNEIASQAYGNPAERVRIIEANGIIDPDLIIAGESLVIPRIPEIATLTRQFSVKEDGFRLKIGERIIPVVAGKVLRTMDTPADGWSATIAWEPGLDKELDKLLTPFTFPEASVFLDGQLMISGRLYNVKNKFGNQGRSKDLEGFSFTIDLVDSHLFPPYQYQNMTLFDFCVKMSKIMGVSVIIDSEIDVSGQFKEEKINQAETIVKFLQRIADKKSALLSSTRAGDFLITRANTKEPIVGTIEEGEAGVENWEGDFKGRKLFRTYRGILKKKTAVEGKIAVLIDTNVPVQRIKTFQITEGDEKDLEAAVKWERNKNLASAMSFSIPVDSWYAPNGELWEENTRALVKSPTLEIPAGFIFLIRHVEFIFEEKGETAVLNLIPPTLYTKEEPILPWAEKSLAIGFEQLRTG